MPKPKNHFNNAITHFRKQILKKGKIKHPKKYTHSFTDRELLTHLGLNPQFRQYLTKLIEDNEIDIDRPQEVVSVAKFNFKRGELNKVLKEFFKTAEGKNLLPFTKTRHYLEHLIQQKGILAFRISEGRLNTIIETEAARKRGIKIITKEVESKLIKWIDEENFNKLVELYLENYLNKHQ